MQGPFKISHLCFLVVDDSSFARSFIRNALNSFGCKSVLEAADGPSCIDILKHNDVDMLLLDNEMSPLSGVDVTALIRHSTEVRDPRIPIIMVSGITDAHRVLEARNAGINDFLAKPFSAEMLWKRIQMAVINPLPYVVCDAYVGPSRRRREKPGARQRDRRENSNGVQEMPSPLSPAIAQVLAAVWPQAKINSGPVVRQAEPTQQPLSRRVFKAGETIFLEGDPGSEAFVVEEGRVAIFKQIDGIRTVLGHIEPKGIFGEMALIDDQPRMAGAVADTDTICTAISKDALQKTLDRTPPLALTTLKALLRHIRSLGMELVETRALLDDVAIFDDDDDGDERVSDEAWPPREL